MKEEITQKHPINEQHLKTIKSLKNELKLMFFDQYIGKITQNFASRLKKLCDIHINFTMTK